MKLANIDRGFKPQFKCGAEVAIALGIAGMAAGVGGSIVSANASEDIANKNLRAQRDENAVNRAWQTAEAEKARQYSTSERLASQQYGIDVMNMMNQYNTPVNQVARLQQAGLNPQVAMSGGSVQNVSASSQPSTPGSPSMPGTVQGLSPVSQQPIDLQVPQLLNGVSSMLTGIANARKAGVETTYLEKSMDLNLANLEADFSLKDAQAIGVKLDNAIKKVKMPYAWKQAYYEYKKAAYDAGVSYQMQGKVSNEAELAAANARLADASTKLKDSEQQLVAQDVASYSKRLNGTLKLQRAQANQANASAEESRANAAVLNEEKRIRAVAADVRESGKSKELDSLLKDLDAKGAISQAQYKQAAVSIKRLNHILENYGSVVGSKEVDAELENFFRIIGLSTSVSTSLK